MWWYGFVALIFAFWAIDLRYQIRRIADAAERRAHMADLDMRRRYGDDYDNQDE